MLRRFAPFRLFLQSLYCVSLGPHIYEKEHKESTLNKKWIQKCNCRPFDIEYAINFRISWADKRKTKLDLPEITRHSKAFIPLLNGRIPFQSWNKIEGGENRVFHLEREEAGITSQMVCHLTGFLQKWYLFEEGDRV